jgi:two-component system sensor histidine kinase KdpD
MSTTAIARASPDALLALASKEGRGRLKIFVGAAPGVGKTYAMLAAARSEQAGGRDVVAGLVETHGRRETEQVLQGIELLPRAPIVYRHRVMREFDLDGALARKPSLLLVDEFAHTNVPGSRHPKRWQDIDELLAAGIDVWTTLNIQHLESLNDVVLKISKIRVRETVPDKVFDRADEIVLVDLPPDELLKRLAEGKVYVEDTAARAVESFFKPQNLTALRELALRRAAERVDAALVERMQAQAIEGPWAAGERILACVGPDAASPGVVRTAKRVADLMDAPWIAVTVERSGVGLDAAARKQVDTTLKLAESLGAEIHTLTGNDLPDELLRFARFENVTQIVIGRARGGTLRQWLQRSLPQRLMQRSTDIGIHLVPLPADSAVPVKRTLAARMNASAPAHFLYAAVAVAGAVLVSRGLAQVIPAASLSAVFLMAVLFSAVKSGVGPAIFASALSFLTYNFFFIAPLYTFTIAEPYELLALLVYLVVAVVAATLAGRLREQARVSAGRVRAMRRLYEFTRRLSGLATMDAIAEGAASEIHASLGRPVLVLLPQGDELVLAAAWPPEDLLDEAATMAARWAFTHKEAAGFETGTLPIVPWRFLPVRTGDTTYGVVGVMMQGKDGAALDSEAQALLDTLTEQTAAALQRAVLTRDMVLARTATETERVRNTLLASISHDFRTPLSSILGSATSLLTYGDKIDASATRDLLANIREEAEGLDEMVRNLLSITRIESGALELRRDWIDLREIAARVIAATRRRGASHGVVLQWPADVPLVYADAALIEQALGNIVANAVVHTPPTSQIVIDAEVEPGWVRLRVTDDGPGIAAADLPHVFERFVQSGSAKATSNDRGGVGLGLAIARGIMQAHGGTIAAVSPVEAGRGTRMILSFVNTAATEVREP